MAEIRMSSLGNSQEGGLNSFSYDVFGWGANQNYILNLDSYVVTGMKIRSCTIQAVCGIGEHGYTPGDIVNTSAPYPIDSGRTVGHGPSVTYVKDVTSNVFRPVFSTSDRISVIPKGGGNASPLTASAWAIRLVFFYDMKAS